MHHFTVESDDPALLASIRATVLSIKLALENSTKAQVTVSTSGSPLNVNPATLNVSEVE